MLLLVRLAKDIPSRWSDALCATPLLSPLAARFAGHIAVPRFLDTEKTSLYSWTRLNSNGGIAQLGERLHGMQEVSGSIPLTSTNRRCSGEKVKVPFV